MGSTIFAAIGDILLFGGKLLLLVWVLGVIILVHELGHFLWAKKFGVHIYEFSIGMGPVAWSKKGKKDKITYNLRWIPIGGFVSMAGEVYEDDDKVPKKKLLCNKPWYQKLIVMVAGVVNNFILALVLLILYAAIWGGGAITPKVDSVLEDSAAAEAGLVSGDIIREINGYKVGSWDKAQIILHYKNDKDYYEFKVEHEDGLVETYEITPKVVKDEETGAESKVFGVTISNTEINNPWDAIKYGFQKFGTVVDSMVYTLSGLFTGKITLSALSGPVGMFEVVGESFSLSFGRAIQYVIYIIAFLSINVGFINILPFPAFDGGHVVFLLIEKIIGRPVDAKIEGICHTIGFILIFLLMIIVTINDIIKLF